MKTPTWAVVIGIVLMLFGGCGLMKHGQSIMMPDIMDMQKNMIDVAVESIDEDDFGDYEIESPEYPDEYGEYSENELPPVATDSAKGKEGKLGAEYRRKQNQKRAKRMTKEMQDMFVISEFNRKWIIRFGYIGMFVCAIYLMAGAFLANRNVFAIKFVFGALALSIAFTIIQMLVLSSEPSSGLLGKISNYGNMFGLVLDIIILIIFSVINKSDYLITERAPEPEKEDWENF